MESENETEAGDAQNDPPPASKNSARGKLRDLPAEKDPMGAGGRDEPLAV